MAEEEKIDFVEYEEKDLSDYTLIEGFPGFGLVGTIAAKYIIDRLKFAEHGHITCNFFIPIIRIHEGLPVYPSRIYTNDEHKIVVILSEQIIPKLFVNNVAKACAEWIEKKGIKRLISLEGIKTDVEGAAPKRAVYGIAANSRSREMLKKYGLKVIEEGITTGITSLMLLNLRQSDIEAISILGNVNAAADYEAAAELIRKLDEILGLNIEVEPLLKEAKETEKELIKHLQEMKKTGKHIDLLEGKTPMYT